MFAAQQIDQSTSVVVDESANPAVEVCICNDFEENEGTAHKQAVMIANALNKAHANAIAAEMETAA